MIPWFMIIMGTGIVVIWTRDILAGNGFDSPAGLLKARERHSAALMWPHWAAEYLTALLLLTGGLGLLFHALWSSFVSMAALGMLLYTSLNSLAWALAARERYPYSGPMLFGLVGALASLLYILI